MPLQKVVLKPSGLIQNKANITGIHVKNRSYLTSNDCKRMAENPVDDGPNRKRSVLGDLTNNTISEKTKLNKNLKEPVLKKHVLNEATLKLVEDSKPQVRKSKRLSEKQEKEKSTTESLDISYATAKESSHVDDYDETLFETPSAEVPAAKTQPSESESRVPEGVNDFDKEMANDLFSISIYAQDIFRHFREREEKFKIEKYLTHQTDISKSMRAILIDWMAEVQESFELNHETLYLAVKLVDMYLSRVQFVSKANLQLLASTSLLIAAKFDERCPPAIDDFVYICDDAYSSNQIIKTEINILKCINFDLGIPISYTFLRRYARCSKQSMELLTLARYILELSLMEYNFIDVLDSLLAAAALALALKMSKQEIWNKTLEYYAGYVLEDLKELVIQLNTMLKKAGKTGLKTIFSKYSHKIFFEVAKIPPLEEPIF